MAVFRVERNRGYTVMSNHHLRNKELSLKATGSRIMFITHPNHCKFGVSVRTNNTVQSISKYIEWYSDNNISEVFTGVGVSDIIIGCPLE